VNCLKTILKLTLKLTLKQLQHVSVQSHHHQRAHYSCLLKLLPNSATYTHQQGPTIICTHVTTHRWILIGYFNSCTSASTSNALPDDGVTAPKHVGAVLMSILMLILKLFLRQFTCASVDEWKTLIMWRCTVCMWKRVKRLIAGRSGHAV
jgi:hypothetical protein